ncbi:MAG: DNA repair protein RecO [Candidatus Eremiobacteraeota bacterium]|nr:DNA repair protein RecO [Candidatus Eremiobacteraeota bacterium]
MNREATATDVLLLKRRPFRDGGDLLEGLSRCAGRVAGVLRRSSRSILDPPVLVHLVRREGPGLDTFSQPVVQTGYSGIRRNLDSMLVAGFLGRLYLASLPQDEPNETVFEALCQVYEALGEGVDARACGLWGQSKLLDCLGLAPQLRGCVLCGLEPVFGFSAADGGVLCRSCFQGNGFRVVEAELSLARLLRLASLRQVSSELLDPDAVRVAGKIYKAQFQTHLELSADYFKRVLPRKGEKA